MCGKVGLWLFLVVPVLGTDYQVTIYPSYLSQGGRTHFETDRWDGHNGLDSQNFIAKAKSIATESGRWLNRDLNGRIFQNTPQDPNHHGYPDPNHFKDPTFVQNICAKYKKNLQGYGNDLDIVMEIKGLYWPKWMNTSQHGGKFPNNLDAGSEFIVLLFKSIKQCTHGIIPKYFEVINEPDAAWKYIKWNTVIDFHKIVAKKLKRQFPGIKVGGPTKNGAISGSDKNDFRIWEFSRQFLDMSLDHLDFFSFHPYNFFLVKGNNYRFEGINEARLAGFIDLVESYANQKKGRSVPLIISEYGLSQVRGINVNKPNPFIDWAYINQHNSHMFTYLNFRNVIDRAIGFMLSYATTLGQASLHYSLFHRDGSFANAAKAYKFWHHLSYQNQFLRIDSPFDNKERKISPLALGNPNNGDILILLHNYDRSQARIKLNFDRHWFTPSSGISHCQYLNTQKQPVLKEWKSMHVSNGYVTVPADGSCIFVFHSKYNFHNIHTIKETTYYGKKMVMRIKKDCTICIFSCASCTYAVSSTVNVHSLGNVKYARLRIGVSLPGKSGGNPTPKTVLINNHHVTAYYQLFAPGRGHEDTRWEIYEYRIPANFLRSNSNEVKVEFNQSGGYVSTVALLIGN
ncbi:beta-porphyranase A-like [Mytilus californianus]|uniref:beta-porphyranase A-like n=1 Tax=Mytilus californianus TaxID=6549 RepID=UPI002245F8E1|nr:beta-porphyranase A-like [Mytilus californianus]